jgi:DnaJ-domain-containing protein 1
LNESWSFLIVALCAVAGHVVVAAVLSKREVSRKQSEDAPEAKDSGRGEVPPEQWYEILNVSPSASTEEIQAAFRTEISKYHPDRVANLGFELRALAESRSKKINNAYMEGLRVRGGRGRAPR